MAKLKIGDIQAQENNLKVNPLLEKEIDEKVIQKGEKAPKKSTRGRKPKAKETIEKEK